MRYVEIGGVRLSAVGVGCWQFGSQDWGYGDQYGETTAGQILQRALDLGVSLIDTAEVYARGVSEAIVGRAIAGRREEAFVATKLLPVWPTAERTYEHARTVPTARARRDDPRHLPENLERAAPVIDALRRVAAAHDATPAQVALAWLLRRPNVVVIPGASSVEQLEHNVAAADLDLSEDEDAELTAASDAYEPLGPVATARGLLAGRLGR